jgi:hypothetical protein
VARTLLNTTESRNVVNSPRFTSPNYTLDLRIDYKNVEAAVLSGEAVAPVRGLGVPAAAK